MRRYRDYGSTARMIGDYDGAAGSVSHWQQCRWCHAYAEAPLGQEVVVVHRRDCPVLRCVGRAADVEGVAI